MNHIFTPLALAASLVFFSTAGLAEERPEHFKGLPAPNLVTAVENFNTHNALLAEQLAAELTPAALAEVHRLSYTLEIALKKISQEVGILADTLEEIHIASETAEPETMAARGKDYLETVRQLGLLQ